MALVLTLYYGTELFHVKLAASYGWSLETKFSHGITYRKGDDLAGICALSCSDEETISHLFTKCIIWKNVLDHICDQFHLPCTPLMDSLSSSIRNWAGNFPRNSSLRHIPFHMMWIIWKAQNLAIF